MTVVGRVAGLWRYPVKSMAAEELDGTEVSRNGLAGDRRWAFIRDGCVVPTIDPVTLRRDPAILRTIACERGNRFGVYGSTVEPGRVAVGDPVELEP